MSHDRISAESFKNIAYTHIPWEVALTEYEEIAQVFDPVRRQAKAPQKDHRHRQLIKNVHLTDQACRMLCSLNDYDRMKVTEEILALSKNPGAPDVARNRRNPLMRLARKRYPFKGYHYVIQFMISHHGIVVSDIFYDRQLLRPQAVPGMERNALYRVKRLSTTRFGEDKFDKNTVPRLQEAWETAEPEPTHRIETSHAAVNGMQNTLTKAAWLMGAHLDASYPKDKPDDYTLFHNPSDGAFEDLYECSWDKRALNPTLRFGRNSFSANVTHLMAALQEAQQRGHKTQWVAHSQGAIIFSRAVDLHRQRHGGSLNMHTVRLHGAGCHVSSAKYSCKKAGMTVLSAMNNPFDPVPNLAGGNNLSASGLYRALFFSGLAVVGKDPLASPHTLPYLGIKTYHKQLVATGNYRRAKHVQKFMLKNPVQA